MIRFFFDIKNYRPAFSEPACKISAMLFQVEIPLRDPFMSRMTELFC